MTTLLCVITVQFQEAKDLLFSFPFHAEPLWTQLQEKAQRFAEVRANSTDLALREVLQQSLKAHTKLQSASLLSSTIAEAIVVTSTHTPNPLVLHPEGLREVMKFLLKNGFPGHCVMLHDGTCAKGEEYWQAWEYKTALEARRAANDALYGGPMRSAWAPQRHIPGELTLPLPKTAFL